METESKKRTEELDTLIEEQKRIQKITKDAIAEIITITVDAKGIYRDLEKNIYRIRHNGKSEILQDISIIFLALAMIAHFMRT